MVDSVCCMNIVFAICNGFYLVSSSLSCMILFFFDFLNPLRGCLDDSLCMAKPLGSYWNLKQPLRIQRRSEVGFSFMVNLVSSVI